MVRPSVGKALTATDALNPALASYRSLSPGALPSRSQYSSTLVPALHSNTATEEVSVESAAGLVNRPMVRSSSPPPSSPPPSLWAVNSYWLSSQLLLLGRAVRRL